MPAKNAKIGMVDKILTRIMTRETVNKTQSTFMIDCHQISKCLRLRTEKSLIVIDEFGKGTDICDGPVLFAAIMKNLAQQRNCPRVVAATHFKEIFSPRILGTEFPGMKHHHMSICFTKRAGSKNESRFSDESITYLYRLEDGIATGSFGI